MIYMDVAKESYQIPYANWGPKEILRGILAEILPEPDTDYAEYFGEYVSLEDIRSLFDYLDLPWSDLVQIDVERAIDGKLPLYFMDHEMWGLWYYTAYDIQIERTFDLYPRGGLQHIGAIMESAIVALESRFYRVPREMGWACPIEQSFFYQTPLWQNCAKATRYLCGYRCTRCQGQDEELHIHHNIPILSAYHHHFALNFAGWKLEALCKHCHNQYHRNTIRSVTHYGFTAADAKTVAEEKVWLRQAWKKHHQDGACHWCNSHNHLHASELPDVDFYSKQTA